MQFELTEALIDDILFSMEDQNGEFLLDTVEGIVVGGMEGSERYISLPEWDSASGFRLMERFAAGSRNPMVRKDLSAALDRGRGVFRAFKDTLSRYPEAEKLWFSFKEKEMKREILRWYNGLREEWGLEKLGAEPEETGDLLLEDFRFRPLLKEDIGRAEELHLRCLEEYRETLAETVTGSFETGLAAESAGSEFAGYISGIVKDTSLYIKNLEVKPEFRGLGIGEALLSRFLDSLDPNQVSQVFLDLPSWAEGFSRVLLRESFKPYSVRYWLKPDNR